MAFASKIHTSTKRFLERILILIEFFLALRFVMEFLAANAASFVVKILYQLTDFLVWPFKFIFPNFYWQGHFVDVFAISAIVGYLIAFFLILGVLNLLKKS